MKPEFEELRRQIRKEMNDYADVISTGRATSWEHYRQMTGVIEGLALAERMLLDLSERFDRMEDAGEVIG